MSALSKNEIRKTTLKYRKNLDSCVKQSLNKLIFENVTADQSFLECENLLCYVSTSIEVDTKAIINFALNHNKSVFVPKCVSGTNIINFYRINSLEELFVGDFNILEPPVCEDKLYKNEKESVCIVPGLCFDENGYRIGYGKGFYDRFLCGYSYETIGICYGENIVKRLPFDSFDIKCKKVITENKVLGENNG